MLLLERFQSLLECKDETSWKEELLQISRELGFNYALFAITHKPKSNLEPAFLCSTYPKNWLDTYFQKQMAYFDPVVTHSRKCTAPIVWSPHIFLSIKQKELYEEAQGYGLRSGVTLPIHGPENHLGILSFANDRQPGSKQTQQELKAYLPALALLRDIAFDTGIKYAFPFQKQKLIPSYQGSIYSHSNWK